MLKLYVIDMGNPISGEGFTDKPINEYAFPTAERLSTVSIEELKIVGWDIEMFMCLKLLNGL